MVCQRPTTPKPRVRRKKRGATRVHERWALDATHVDCGTAGWGHLIAVIDCYDRASGGWECVVRGRANEAERALEMAWLARFGTLRPCGEVPIIRSDNGLIVQSRRFRAACQLYRLQQALITPYTPEQNGVIERWFRSVKEECVWQQRFDTFQEARQAIKAWVVQPGTATSILGVSQPACLSCVAQCTTTRPVNPVLAGGVARERSARGRPSASPRRSRASRVEEIGDWVV
jgi:putative transposase